MDKVRKSNSKFLSKKKADANVNPMIKLQESSDKGDGVHTAVEGGVDDNLLAEELLNYDDDLSVEEDFDGDRLDLTEDEVEEQVTQNTSSADKGPGCASSQPTENVLMENPVLQRMMESFFHNKFKDMMKEAVHNQQPQPGTSEKVEGEKVVERKSNDFVIRQLKGDETVVARKCINESGDPLRSPSDTTVYAPVLQYKLTPQNQVDRVFVTMNQPQQPMPLGITTETDNNNLNLVSQFIESVRLDQHPEDINQERRRSEVLAEELKEAQLRAERSIIEVEKFRAAVEMPGKPIENITNNGTDRVQVGTLEQTGGGSMTIMDIGSGVSDDDFFHLTCHIQPSLIYKIEKGEFIELEKLLPKDKFAKGEENRLEWVQRDGGTFLVPAQKENKINNFRRWEQALRAYATIYCGANPHRSKEIWQYITVINTAASSYLWDNVYNYDITFRHLMAFNPQRSWAVTYNQMWNLSMRDPLPKISIDPEGCSTY